MSKRVLLIEDDAKFRDEMKLPLIMRGYEIYEASNGLAGLEMVRAKKPQVILQDLLISKIDGFRLARLIKFDERYANIVMIAITQLTREETKEEAKRMGFDYFFSKPIDVDALADKVDEIFIERGQ